VVEREKLTNRVALNVLCAKLHRAQEGGEKTSRGRRDGVKVLTAAVGEQNSIFSATGRGSKSNCEGSRGRGGESTQKQWTSNHLRWLGSLATEGGGGSNWERWGCEKMRGEMVKSRGKLGGCSQKSERQSQRLLVGMEGPREEKILPGV